MNCSGFVGWSVDIISCGLMAAQTWCGGGGQVVAGVLIVAPFVLPCVALGLSMLWAMRPRPDRALAAVPFGPSLRSGAGIASRPRHVGLRARIAGKCT